MLTKSDILFALKEVITKISHDDFHWILNQNFHSYENSPKHSTLEYMLFFLSSNVDNTKNFVIVYSNGEISKTFSGINC